jgi:hypothetical protein
VSSGNVLSAESLKDGDREVFTGDVVRGGDTVFVTGGTFCFTGELLDEVVVVVVVVNGLSFA